MRQTSTLTPKQIADYYIISPAEAFASARWQDEREKHLPSIAWCNETLTKTMSKMLLGEMIGILGYSGDGKTSLALAQAYHAAKALMREQKDLENYVAFYTYDQPVAMLERKLEKMIRYDRAQRKQIPIEQVNYSLTDRITLPLWFAGKDTKRMFESQFKMPPLTVERIGQVLEGMMTGDKKPLLVIVDYAQRVPIEKDESRTETVLRVAEKVADFTVKYNVTTILTIQSGRGVKARADKTPMMQDIQHSSALEHVLDKLIGIWHPANTEPLGTLIDVNGSKRAIDRETMKAASLKDRGAETNVAFAFPFDFSTMQIGDYAE